MKTIFFIIGLVIFVFLTNEFGIENIVINIQKTGWWLLPIIGVWFIVYLMNALAWWFVLKSQRKKVSFLEIFSISLSGFAINYITPVVNLGGEPYKIIALKEKLGIHKAVSSVLLYSMLHFLSSFVFWIMVILLMFLTIPLSFDLQIILGAGFIAAVLGVLFFYSRHKNGIINSLIKIISKLPFTTKLITKIKLEEDSLITIDNQIVDFYGNNKFDFYISLMFEVAARFVASIEFIFILRAIGINISFQEALYINAFSSFVMNIFFFVPLELGVREGSLYFIMNILKFSSGIGIYIGLVNRIREFFWIFIGLLLIQLRKTNLPNKEVINYADIK
ncbi:MAG: flippase-like domain-containing protein [Ignavibacteriae bacterium]|nr:flippase-like domain-containing protein [Ignavibacteriota bacterium]